MRCLGCHYDLRDLTEHRCPECGRAFDPSDPKSYFVRHRVITLRRVACVATVAYVLSLAITIYLSITELPGDTTSLLLSPVYAALIALIFVNPICLILYMVGYGLVRMINRSTTIPDR
jgi:hypothetical protein